MDFANLLGGYWTAFSAKAEIQSAKNLRLEKIESGAGRNQFAMYRNYGLKVCGSNYAPTKLICRGFLELNDHLFDIQDDTIYELDSNCAVVNSYGSIGTDGLICSMDASLNSLFVVSSNILYRINSSTLTTPTLDFTPIAVGVIEGIVIAIAQGTNRFYFSTDDGVTWDSLDYETAEAYPNALLNLVIDHQELWLFGNRRTQVFNVGADPSAPFVKVSAGVIEMGLAAKLAVVKLDNSIFWLGRNRDGEHQVWRANGYSPVRVSNNAIESAIRSYPNTDDAIMQSFTIASPVIRLTFPSANNGRGASWDFDVATGQWYDVGYWNPALTRYERHRGNCYVSAFGKTIVGDYANGFLYEMSPDFNSDFGYPLRWVRRTPHNASEGKQVQYKRLDVFMQVGVGLTTPVWLNDHSIDAVTFAASLAALVSATTITQAQSDAMQAIYNWTPFNLDLTLPAPSVMTPLGFFDWGNNPQVGMRYSDDGGETWSAVRYRDIGCAGSFNQRIYWNRLGKSRDRVWEISGDAPVATAIVAGSFDAQVLLT